MLPEQLVRPVECLSQSFYISPHELSQRAAIHAFDGQAEMETVKAGYDLNRRELAAALPQFGFTRIAPVQGAFYMYAGIEELASDSMAFVDDMLEQAGVAATPGLDFDERRGHQFVRFSFAGTGDDIREAVDRLANWLK